MHFTRDRERTDSQYDALLPFAATARVPGQTREVFNGHLCGSRRRRLGFEFGLGLSKQKENDAPDRLGMKLQTLDVRGNHSSKTFRCFIAGIIAPYTRASYIQLLGFLFFCSRNGKSSDNSRLSERARNLFFYIYISFLREM